MEKLSVLRIAALNNLAGHFFFLPATMAFYGDKISSFGILDHEGENYLYRRPNATIHIHGRHQKAGKYFFGCWHFDLCTSRLCVVDKTIKDAVYKRIMNGEGWE